MARLGEEIASISAAVVDSSPSAIIAVDLDGKIISWNPAAEGVTGFSAAEALGANLISIMPDAERERAARLMARVRGGEVISNQEVRRLRRDGSMLVASLTLAPIRDDDGEITGTVGIMHDLAGRRAMEGLLRRNQRLASVGTLAAGIAHEINNPVGGILMAAQYAGAALDREGAQAVVKQALEDIEADAKRCGEIVRRLSRLAREERGERSETDPGDVISAAIELADRIRPGSVARVRFVRPEALPPVVMNVTEIEQALVNIICNAVQANCTTVSIDARVPDDDAKVLVSIVDDGTGIADEIIDHLFDPFFTTERQNGRSGLGLSVARAIVADHGGSLDVTSSLHRGTTVTLELPLSPQDTD